MARPQADMVTLKIPRPLYNRLAELISGTGFRSVTEFSVYVLRDLAGQFRARAEGIAAATGTTIDVEPSSFHQAALASPDVQAAIVKAADGHGLARVLLASGAGHDAQIMSKLGRMGMIFVPSAGGVSHSPRECTSWEDCARGADVLLASVLALDELQSRAASGI